MTPEINQQVTIILAALMYKMGWSEIRLSPADLARITSEHMIQSYQVLDPAEVVVKLFPPPPPVHDFYQDGEVIDVDLRMIEPSRTDN
jgi:hypothetical protein